MAAKAGARNIDAHAGGLTKRTGNLGPPKTVQMRPTTTTLGAPQGTVVLHERFWKKRVARPSPRGLGGLLSAHWSFVFVEGAERLGGRFGRKSALGETDRHCGPARGSSQHCVCSHRCRSSLLKRSTEPERATSCRTPLLRWAARAARRVPLGCRR
jgi:hypothetical protein